MKLGEIRDIVAKKVFNSNGKPTISVIVKTEKGTVETSAPQGTSKGKNEVAEFSGKGIDYSIQFVKNFGKKLIDANIDLDSFYDLEDIEEYAQQFDSSEHLSLIGGNALYALEASLLKTAAMYHGFELWEFLLGKREKMMPRPIGNVVGGGAHVHQEVKTDFQEFLLLPETKHFFDAYFVNIQAYKELQEVLPSRDGAWQETLTNENAFATTLSNTRVLDLLKELKEYILDKFEINLGLGIDMAASNFCRGSSYIYKNFPSRNVMRKEEQINYVYDLIRKHELVYVEDPFHEEDFASFSKLTKKVKKRCLICGDDLTCTNPYRLEKAIKEEAINAIIIKPNQIGSLIKMRQTIELAKKHGITPIISHRSGETEDDTIADFAVGFQIPYIKTGIIGDERLAKLNRLIQIERQE